MRTLRKGPLAVFVGGLAVAVAVSLITAPSSSGEQPAKKRAAPASQAQAYAQSRVDVAEAAVPVVVFAPLYGSSPRIIHVPQPEQDAQASANAGDEAVGAIDGDANARLVRRIRPAPRN
jgi:hypothetical protein